MSTPEQIEPIVGFGNMQAQRATATAIGEVFFPVSAEGKVDNGFPKRGSDFFVFQEAVPAQRDANPPPNGKLILQFLVSSERLDEMLGDLTEQFGKIAKERGLVAARWWYWWQVASSSVNFVLTLVRGAKVIWDLFNDPAS